jgi:5-methylcytosine-specific restriction protein A
MIKPQKSKKMKWENTNSKGYTELSRLGFYSSSRWIKTRKYIIEKEPLCRECLKKGKVKPAQMVDHIIPISEDSSYELKFGEDNLRPLCYSCHRIITNIDNSKNSELNLKKGRDLMDFLESD